MQGERDRGVHGEGHRPHRLVEAQVASAGLGRGPVGDEGHLLRRGQDLARGEDDDREEEPRPVHHEADHPEARRDEKGAERRQAEAPEALEPCRDRDLEERDQHPVHRGQQAEDHGRVSGGLGDRQRQHRQVAAEDQREEEPRERRREEDSVPQGVRRPPAEDGACARGTPVRGGRRGGGRRGDGDRGPRLGNGEVDEGAKGERREAVAEEEETPVPVSQHAPEGGARGPAQVHRHAHSGEAARAVGGGQQVADHRGSRRTVEVGDEAKSDEEQDEGGRRRDDTHGHGEDAGSEEADEQRAPSAEAVGDEAAREDRHERADAEGEQQPRRLGLPHVEVPEEDEGQVGNDEGPQLVDERPHDQETHGAWEAPDDPERVLEHGANGPLYNGPPHRRERRCTSWSCCGTARAPGTSRTASRGGRTWTSRRRVWRRRSPGRSS